MCIKQVSKVVPYLKSVMFKWHALMLIEFMQSHSKVTMIKPDSNQALILNTLENSHRALIEQKQRW